MEDAANRIDLIQLKLNQCGAAKPEEISLNLVTDSLHLHSVASQPTRLYSKRSSYFFAAGKDLKKKKRKKTHSRF